MIVTGFFRRITKDGEPVDRANARFESTGRTYEDGKVIWRKIAKDGTRTNIFAEQFNPRMPWIKGKWFIKVDGGVILRQYPELKAESENAKKMTHEEYCKFLSDNYYI